MDFGFRTFRILGLVWVVLAAMVGCTKTNVPPVQSADAQLSDTALWRQGLKKAEARDYAGALAEISLAQQKAPHVKYRLAIAHINFLNKEYRAAQKGYEDLIASNELTASQTRELRDEVARMESASGDVTGISVAGQWIRATAATVAAEAAIDADNYAAAYKNYDKAYQYSRDFTLLLESALAASKAKQWDWAHSKYREYLAVGGDEVGRDMQYRVVAEVDRIMALMKGEQVVTLKSLADEIYAERSGDEAADGLPPSMAEDDDNAAALAQAQSESVGESGDAEKTGSGDSEKNLVEEKAQQELAAASQSEKDPRQTAAEKKRLEREAAEQRAAEARERRLALKKEHEEKKAAALAEKQRLAEERKAALEAKKEAEKQRRAEAKARREAEKQRLADERRVEQEAKAREREIARQEAEAARQEKEAQREAEEAQRLAEKEKQEEEKRLAAEEARREAESRREAAKEARHKATEERERIKEEQRLAAIAKAEAQKRQLEELKRQKAEERQRKAEERKREDEERKASAEQKRLEREEAKRIAAEHRKAEQEEKAAEKARKAAELALAKEERALAKAQEASSVTKSGAVSSADHVQAGRAESSSATGGAPVGNAANAQGAAAKEPATTFEDLLFYANSKSATVRFRAVKELIPVSGERARIALENRVVGDHNIHVRFLAIGGLAQRRSTASLPVLDHALLTAATSQERAVLKNAINTIRLGLK